MRNNPAFGEVIASGTQHLGDQPDGCACFFDACEMAWGPRADERAARAVSACRELRTEVHRGQGGRSPPHWLRACPMPATPSIMAPALPVVQVTTIVIAR
jgi:hypothetical protein